MTKIAIIVGSHRPKSESAKVGAYCAGTLTKLGHETVTIDLGKTPFPLWDEGLWAESSLPSGVWNKDWDQASKAIAAVDGMVVISPEWGGMVPAGLKNLFLLCNKKEMVYKPALIVAVSAGRGGSYPVAELRTSSYKNTKIFYLPEHVIVRDVASVLNEKAPKSKDDELIRERLDYTLNVLAVVSEATKSVRQNPLIASSPFPNGM